MNIVYIDIEDRQFQYFAAEDCLRIKIFNDWSEVLMLMTRVLAAPVSPEGDNSLSSLG